MKIKFYKKIFFLFLILINLDICHSEVDLAEFSTDDPLDLVSEMIEFRSLMAPISVTALILPVSNTTLSIIARLANHHKKRVAKLIVLDIEKYYSENNLTQLLTDALVVMDSGIFPSLSSKEEKLLALESEALQYLYSIDSP